MRKILLSLLTMGSLLSAKSQIIIDFESLSLPKNDTFYVNYNSPGQDVGFTIDSIHFDCEYDTAWGGTWNGGFAYSNMTDSITSGFLNQYAAKPAKGYNGSNQYLVYWDGYGSKKKIKFNYYAPPAIKSPTGFYVTNSTYAYNSMRDGDFVARKFGDTTGTGSGLPQGSYPDWFLLTIKGYSNGSTISDSVNFYLADFRDTNNANDYIIDDWQWVDLQPLGVNVDSLAFHLSSSDTGQFGMNTPAYFCMDNFIYQKLPVSIAEKMSLAAKVYPNPAIHELHIELLDSKAKTIQVLDINGRVLKTLQANSKINTISIAGLPKGMYWVQIHNGQQTASQRFIKQ